MDRHSAGMWVRQRSGDAASMLQAKIAVCFGGAPAFEGAATTQMVAGWRRGAGCASVQAALCLRGRRADDEEVQGTGHVIVQAALCNIWLGGLRVAAPARQCQALPSPHVGGLLGCFGGCDARPAAGGVCSERPDGKGQATGVTGANLNCGCGASMAAQPQAVEMADS